MDPSTSPTLRYDSSGILGTSGYWPYSIGGISFNGNSGGSFAAPGSVLLGTISNSNGALPPGSELTFRDVPFTINLSIYNNSTPSWQAQTLVLKGTLSGALTGPNLTSLTANVTSIVDTTPPWYTRLLDPAGLKILTQAISWSGKGSSSSPLVGYVDRGSISLPEPTSLAIFAVTLGGAFGARRSRQAIRARSTR
jgi:hypothetical protein